MAVFLFFFSLIDAMNHGISGEVYLGDVTYR